MQRKRKHRIYAVASILLGASVSVSLLLYALRQNIDLYYTPTQLLAQPLRAEKEIRVGGVVVKNSIHQIANSLKVSFRVTDYHQAIDVYYEGLLPSLFHEGQGVIVQGFLSKRGIFRADQVLAKHDENYHPPDIKGSM